MQIIHCTYGGEAQVESHTFLLMVSGDTDVLAVHVHEESHEDSTKGVSSVPGRDWAGGLQGTFAHPSQCDNHGLEKGW